jgi:hypothetical protein
MAKERKPRSSVTATVTLKALSPEQIRFRRQVALNALVLSILLIGGAVGYSYVRDYVEHKLTFATEPPRVVLKDRPVWMSDFLADQIVGRVQPATAGSAFDQRMLINVYEILKHDPWIRSIRQVRRAYGHKPGDTIEIDCEYRAPIALVRYGDVYALVDGEGVKLPELFSASHLPRIMFGQDGRINIRLIEGVSRPPPEPGRKWVSEDLAAGLELVQMIYGKAYAEEIVSVNVQNYAGRDDPREAWLVMQTRDHTEVRWGRPRSASDAVFSEVPWTRKLEYMEKIVQQYHRVDAGHTAVDLRFDRVTFPSDELGRGGGGGGRERSAGLREGP